MPGPSIQARLSQFWIFQGFSQAELATIGHLFREQELGSGSALYRQGEAAESLYLVVSGEVKEEVQGVGGQVVVRRRAVAGDILGQRPLLDKQPHKASATVVQTARVLTVEGGNLATVLSALSSLEGRLRRTEVVNRLLGIPLFGALTDEELRETADLVRMREYSAGQSVYDQGEPSDAVFVIDSGRVLERLANPTSNSPGEPRYVTAGNFFGYQGLSPGAGRRGSATVLVDVKLFRVEAEAVDWLSRLHEEFKAALERDDVLPVLQRTKTFSGFKDEELRHLAGFVGLAHFRPRDIIHYQGELDSTLYVLYDGSAAKGARGQDGQESPREYVSVGDVVGAYALFLQDPCDSTLESITKTSWLYLARSDLNEFLAEHRDLAKKLVLDPQITARQQLKRPKWMEPGEQLVMNERRHWFLPVIHMLWPFLLFVIGLVVLLLPSVWGPMAYGLLSVSLLWMLWQLVDWLNDHYLITTSRVAHREKVLLIRETRDETPLESIQNVNINQGFLGNLLGFGTLLIDTAARSGSSRVVFTYVTEPEQVKTEIFRRVNQARASKRFESQRAIQDTLEMRIGRGVRPQVPRPVVQSVAASTPAPSPQTGIWERFDRATLRNWLWIERRSDGAVTWRKHWIRLLTRIWAPTLAMLSLTLLGGLAVVGTGVLSVVVLPVLVLPMAVSLGWLWWNWQNWGNDLYTVTNDRLIDTEALPLGFRTKRTETTFDRIQNVSFEIPNPIAMLLNYGTVAIFTAGAQGRLDFSFVRNPRSVQSEIFHRLAAYREAQQRLQVEEQMAQLPEWFAVYDEARRS